MLNLDILASVFCIILAMSCFAIHILTSPRHRVWLNLPEYVRGGIFVTGALMFFRGINFYGLAANPTVPLGHVNIEGLMPLIVLTYTMTALSVHVIRQTYPGRLWDRLRFFESVAKHGLRRPDSLQAGVLAEIADHNGCGIVTAPDQKPPTVDRRSALGR